MGSLPTSSCIFETIGKTAQKLGQLVNSWWCPLTYKSLQLDFCKVYQDFYSTLSAVMHLALAGENLNTSDVILIFISAFPRMSTVEYRYYLESHGFLFKILIKMCPLSIDGAILIWVLG